MKMRNTGNQISSTVVPYLGTQTEGMQTAAGGWKSKDEALKMRGEKKWRFRLTDPTPVNSYANVRRLGILFQ